jgi:hypothetical protein
MGFSSRMSTTRVIEAINVLKDCDLNRSTCLPGIPPDHLYPDGFEESFHRSIVITISLATHRYFEPMQAQDFMVVTRAILAAAI